MKIFKLALSLGLISLCSSLYATQFTVTRLDDPIPDGCQSIALGDPADDCSLREAVIAANASTEDDNTIVLDSGIYQLTIVADFNNPDETGALKISDPASNAALNFLTIVGNGADRSIIDASAIGVDERPAGGNQSGVFDIHTTNGGLDVTFRNLAIRGGSSPNAGGAIAAVSTGDGDVNDPPPAFFTQLTLDHCLITGNEAQDNGGAVYVQSFGNVVVDSCAFTNNNPNEAEFQSNVGGGISMFDGRLSIINSTFSGNRADFGGAIGIDGFDFDNNPGSIRIFNSTITQNIGEEEGGGVWVGTNIDSIILSNSIISQNIQISQDFMTNLNSPDCAFFEDDMNLIVISSRGFNILGDSCDQFDVADITDQFGIDPQLLPLADNGGPTPTHAVLADTPAYNAGNPDNCNNGQETGPAQDQRGQHRVADGNCEIGAFENGVIDLEVVKEASQSSVDLGEQFNYTLTVTNAGPDIAMNPIVTDTLPAGVQFVAVALSGNAGVCEVTGQALNCNLDPIDIGDQAVITVTVTATQAGTAINNAQVVGDPDTDTDTSNNTDSVEVEILDDGTDDDGDDATGVNGDLQGGGGFCSFDAAGLPALGHLATLSGIAALLAFRSRKRD